MRSARLHKHTRQNAAPAPAALGDLRFRALVSDADWASLPPAVRRRFSKRLAAGDTVVYSGTVTHTRMSRAGWWLAQLARLVGGPLPLACEPGAASVVTVTEDGASGGQVWTRLYARARGFPQIIHSTKRFAGPTGLEEYVGCGIGMALHVAVLDGALEFHSAGYFVQVLGHRICLPEWATPGSLVVTHAETGPKRFRFTLAITHPRLGCLLDQAAMFEETTQANHFTTPNSP